MVQTCCYFACICVLGISLMACYVPECRTYAAVVERLTAAGVSLPAGMSMAYTADGLDIRFLKTWLAFLVSPTFAGGGEAGGGGAGYAATTSMVRLVEGCRAALRLRGLELSLAHYSHLLDFVRKVLAKEVGGLWYVCLWRLGVIPGFHWLGGRGLWILLPCACMGPGQRANVKGEST